MPDADWWSAQGRIATPCKPRPRERLWTLTKAGKRIDAELLFHAEHGVEIQFLHEGVMAFRWAARKGYLQRSPISEDTTIRRSRIAQRRRRISSIEEKALLDAAAKVTRGAGTRLQWLIIAALETGCRRGELLALTWGDVNLSKGVLLVRAVEEGAKKTGRARQLPISQRLAATLKMAQTDPSGKEYSSTAYVFGELGERVKSVTKAWATACDEATPPLVDLHFHDLRQEAGCRWLEQGWAIHHVQEMLGHANISQTSTYLHATETGLAESMRKFDASRCTPVADEKPIAPPSIGNEEGDDAKKSTLH